MINYKDDGIYKGFPTVTDNGFKLSINPEESCINIKTGHYLDGRKEYLFVENGDSMEEVIKIHYKFFQKTYKNQKAALRLLIWWSIKHYIKILFK